MQLSTQFFAIRQFQENFDKSFIITIVHVIEVIHRVRYINCLTNSLNEEYDPREVIKTELPSLKTLSNLKKKFFKVIDF